METSKVRKFWTFNPFYPELSGTLITFYTVIILACFGVFLIWILFLHMHISSLWVVVLSLLLFYPLVETQKRKIKTKHKVYRNEKKCNFSLFKFFPLFFSFFRFVFSRILNMLLEFHLQFLLRTVNWLNLLRGMVDSALIFYMFLRWGLVVCSNLDYFHIPSS